jgi:hypothetical protein
VVLGRFGSIGFRLRLVHGLVGMIGR